MANWILQARLKKGLGLRAAARALGVSCNAILKWERGDSFPTEHRFKALNKVYGLGVSYLEDMAIRHYVKKARSRLRMRGHVYGKNKGEGRGSKRRS